MILIVPVIIGKFEEVNVQLNQWLFFMVIVENELLKARVEESENFCLKYL